MRSRLQCCLVITPSAYKDSYIGAKGLGIAMWLTYVEDTFELSQGRLHLCLNLHSAKHLNNQTETTISFSHKYTI
jgi:hypothetical protein